MSTTGSPDPKGPEGSGGGTPPPSEGAAPPPAGEQGQTAQGEAQQSRSALGYGLVIGGTAVATAVVVALLVTIFERKQEARVPFQRLVEVDEDTTDPAPWGINWPHQYDSHMKTVDYERTRYGGSDALPESKLERDPWLRLMFSGYAFALDYREARGHAYMLHDQDHTLRVEKRPQPGACLHCHSSPLRAYRFAGDGDVTEGFRHVNAMSWEEARFLEDDEGNRLIEHPVSCVDCHDPETMQLRVTRPAFKKGIADYKASQGIPDYDVNRDATRQEMRTYACAQCHVEYYFRPPNNQLIYPWHKGLKVEEIEAYFDETGFTDWEHGITEAPVLKAQHPEFELYSQGIHARSGVSCADCHMPYVRVGALKVSDHQVRSPLLQVDRACQTCHPMSEEELLARAHRIQDTTVDMIQRSADALAAMISAIATAMRHGATDEQLLEPRALHRKAQWRLDFVYSENSHGFHAPQEAARILAEAIDYARRAEQLAIRLLPPGVEVEVIDPAPVEGATPDEEAPPHAPRW